MSLGRVWSKTRLVKTYPLARAARLHVLYLGEINSSQELAWRNSIEVLDEDAPTSVPRTYALFPEDRCEAVLPEESIVRLKLKALQLHRPRQWGACWLALTLWQMLDLDVFWAERLPPSRKGTRWGGTAAPRLPIYSAPMTHWLIRTLSTGVIGACWSTRRRCLTI